MDLAYVLCMNAGNREGSYAKNSFLQVLDCINEYHAAFCFWYLNNLYQECLSAENCDIQGAWCSGRRYKGLW